MFGKALLLAFLAAAGSASAESPPVLTIVEGEYGAVSPQGVVAVTIHIENGCHIWEVPIILELNQNLQWDAQLDDDEAAKVLKMGIRRLRKIEIEECMGPFPGDFGPQ